jgi:hypothetical protein
LNPAAQASFYNKLLKDPKNADSLVLSAPARLKKARRVVSASSTQKVAPGIENYDDDGGGDDGDGLDDAGDDNDNEDASDQEAGIDDDPFARTYADHVPCTS